MASPSRPTGVRWMQPRRRGCGAPRRRPTMSAQENIQVFLAARPQGMPRETDFGVRSAAVPEPGVDEVVVRNEYVSVDPYMRGHIDGVYSQKIGRASCRERV